jgi:hypothetical protein
MARKHIDEAEQCALCGCILHRSGNYGEPTVRGRSHATKHHFVAERFFGRTGNRKGKRKPLFKECPWGCEGKSAVFCYECHEELLHNPVFLPEEIEAFARLVKSRSLNEDRKSSSREKVTGRIKLFREIIHEGIHSLTSRNSTE